MKTLRFKTTVKCNGCLNAVTPFLNQEGLIKSWKVDLIHPDKILEITADDSLLPERVITLVEYAGYKAEILTF
jgi:copper chaperone CopZ